LLPSAVIFKKDASGIKPGAFGAAFFSVHFPSKCFVPSDVLLLILKEYNRLPCGWAMWPKNTPAQIVF
jgi:hypothetical protein